MAVHTKGVGNTLKRKELEKDIQREIADWLHLNNFMFWRSSNVPAMGRVGANGEMRFRALPKDTPRGLPDLMIIVEGKFIGIEVKRPGAKLRPEQGNFGMRLVSAGADYYCVHSLTEFLNCKFLDNYKAIWNFRDV